MAHQHTNDAFERVAAIDTAIIRALVAHQHTKLARAKHRATAVLAPVGKPGQWVSQG